MQQTEHIMHDIETLDTKPSAVVLSIGAVKFNEDGIGESIYLVLDPEDQVRRGRTISPSTVLWWMQQSDEARSAFLRPSNDVRESLLEYAAFFDHPNYKVWGNGAMFDNTIVLDLFAMYDIPRPWKYSGDRCYRTLKSIVTLDAYATPTTAHNALADAEAQACDAMMMLRKLKGLV